MKPVDLAAVQSIIEEVAQAEIMPRFRKLQRGDVEMKGIDDPVTVADKAAEESLTFRLKDLLPGSAVVGEECCAKDPWILSRLQNDDDVWIVDPIDGTRSFIEGRTQFGVMVACIRRKQTIAAWIHDPNTGHTLAAEEGSGVMMQGKRMHLASRDADRSPLVIVSSRLRDSLSNPAVAQVIANLPAVAIGGAAAFDYARLFAGEVLFGNSTDPRASYLIYRRLKPWDHVPGIFLHAEAGGYSADLSGRTYDRRDGKCGLLIAPNKDAWMTMYEKIKPAISSLDLSDD